MNIIITNIGRRGYLVDYFKALPDIKCKVYVSDCDITASGLYGCNDGRFILPRPVDDEDLYVRELIALCHANDIEVVLPVIDPEIYILSRYKEHFQKEGILVVVSDERVLDICFDKIKMNEFLDSIGIYRPKTFTLYEEFKKALDNKEIHLPVIVKPIFGSGSIDTYVAKDEQMTKLLFSENMIIQEKLEGVEYGTDVFNSFSGVPLRCIIKKKISMRSGETDKSISVKNSEIKNVIMKLANELRHIGNLDVDLIVNGEGVYVIDLNPRFGGGYPATHAIGVNLIDVLYKLITQEEVEPEFDNYKENILVMKKISVVSTELTDEDLMNC